MKTTASVILASILIVATACSGSDSATADAGDGDAATVDARAPDSGADALAPDASADEALALASPFGVHPSSANNFEYARDLQLRWNREGMYFVWEWADQERDGSYSFKRAEAPPAPGSTKAVPIDYDAERLKLNQGELYMMANICPFRRGGSFATEEEKQRFVGFVEALVERYDGDDDLGCSEPAPDCFHAGDGERPSDELVASFARRPTKVWQLCNQVLDTCEGEGCAPANYASHYAEVMKLFYGAVKAADASAQVMIAGDSAADLYPPVYEALEGGYIDIVDIHVFRTEDRYDAGEMLDGLKRALTSAGYDVDTLRIWITEAGTYSGAPVDDRDPPSEGPSFQSEKQQAGALLKMYVSSLAKGVEKVFWAWGIVEGFGCDCCIFDYTGLVYDGNTPPNANGCEQDDAYDRGQGVKKLAYYSYKKMVELLEGSDWKAIETLRADDVRIYKFVDRHGERPVWVAWNDGAEPAVVSVDVGAASRAVVIEGVPSYEAGADVRDYEAAFARESQVPRDGEVSLTLGDVPVFLTVE